MFPRKISPKTDFTGCAHCDVLVGAPGPASGGQLTGQLLLARTVAPATISWFHRSDDSTIATHYPINHFSMGKCQQINWSTGQLCRVSHYQLVFKSLPLGAFYYPALWISVHYFPLLNGNVNRSTDQLGSEWGDATVSHYHWFSRGASYCHSSRHHLPDFHMAQYIQCPL